MNGFGKLKFADGSEFNGKLAGSLVAGQYTLPDKSAFSGSFKDGMYHG